jgi:hypothetical protein
MRILIAATMLFAIGACTSTPAPTMSPAPAGNDQADINQCPRADGQPCK